MIRQGIAEGTFRADLDPQICAFGVLGMSAWTYQWFHKGGRMTADQVAEQFSSMVLSGACADSTPARQRSAPRSRAATRGRQAAG